MNMTPSFDHSTLTQVCFLRFAVRHTPPDQQDPVSTVGGPTEVRFLRLRYARPLPMNRIPFRPWWIEHKAVSSVLRHAMPRFHRLFHPSRLAPDEHDPRFDRSAPTQVSFLRLAVRHTPPDQQDPRFDRRRSVLRYARPLPMNRIPFRS